MKKLKSDELFENLSTFLRERGIEFKEGAYTARIRQSCTLLTQAVNSAQRGLATAKTKVDRKIDEVRQVIHEKTAAPVEPDAGPRPRRRPATGKRKPPVRRQRGPAAKKKAAG